MTHDGHRDGAAGNGTTATVVLHVGGLNWATWLNRSTAW